MNFTHTVPLAASPPSIDLADWIFALTDDEYRACAKGHHAMGVIGGAKRLGLINVEEIAGTLIVQHYRTEVAESDHIRFVSDRSQGFLMHAVPFTMRVWWDMTIAPAPGGGSALTCAIGFDAPRWVTAAGATIGNNHWVRRHLIEETGHFARDIEGKAERSRSAPRVAVAA